MEFNKSRMKDVIAVAQVRLADCDPDAPGPFMLVDQDQAKLWLQTIVVLGKIANWDLPVTEP